MLFDFYKTSGVVVDADHNDKAQKRYVDLTETDALSGIRFLNPGVVFWQSVGLGPTTTGTTRTRGVKLELCICRGSKSAASQARTI